MKNDVITADPTLRRRVQLGILVLFVLLGVAVIFLNQRFSAILLIADAQPSEAAAQLEQMAKMIGFGIMLVGLPLAIWLLSYGIKIVASGSYPPPNTRTIRDVYRQEGNSAYLLGLFAFVMGIVVLGGAVSVYLWLMALVSQILG